MGHAWTRFHRTLAALGFLALLTGCGPPPIPHLAAEPAQSPASLTAVGCWKLRPAGWRPYHLPDPTLVRLDTLAASDSATERFELTVLAPIDSTNPRRFHASSWAPVVGRRALVLFLGDGFSGVDLRLVLAGDRVWGVGYHYTDFPALRSGGRVIGERVVCPTARTP